jgi:hypothetical protein
MVFCAATIDLIEERTEKYFKDVYDHILQANDLAENYRDMMMNLNDLYLSNVNLKMNEVMKVMAVVTCLLAPATVIGGIFGMNFENIKWLHTNTTFICRICHDRHSAHHDQDIQEAGMVLMMRGESSVVSRIVCESEGFTHDSRLTTHAFRPSS